MQDDWDVGHMLFTDFWLY